MRRRKDIFTRSDSIADIQDLSKIAQNKKEELEYLAIYYKRKIEEIKRHIIAIRDEFLSYLRSNNIDPSFPVMNSVTSEVVVPDTSPEQSLTSVSIEQALLPNIPNDVFLILKNVLVEKYVTCQGEIEEYTDILLKLRLNRSSLESKLEAIEKAKQEYSGKIEEKEEDYNLTIKNLQKLKYLYQNLLEFKYLFTVLPDRVTSDEYAKFQDNYLGKYSAYYCGKKRSIKGISDKFQSSYKATTIDLQEDGFYLTVFRDISGYFGPYEDNNLPDQYVDAMLIKVDIIKKLDQFSDSLDKLIENVKMSLDVVRGTKGIGNTTIEGLITSTTEIAQSFVMEKRIEHTTLETIINGNNVIGEKVNKDIQYIKDKLQNGVNNLDEKFIEAQKHLLRKIALTIGFPVKYIYNRTVNLEGHLREKIRQKYGGNIPFCDEIESTDSNGNKVFIKKDNIDSKTGKSITDSEASILNKKTRTDRSILSD